MSNKLISIIIPVYNVMPFLNRCVESVLNQTHRSIQIILVDDGSTDGSREAVNDYVEKYPQKITAVMHKTNRGVSAARNSGIEHIKGQWFSFLDSDDWITNDYCEKMLTSALSENADIVVCNYSHVYDSRKIEIIDFTSVLKNASTHKEVIALMRNHPFARLYRTDFYKLNNIRFPEGIERLEDMVFSISLASFTERISFLNESLYMYYVRKNSVSQQKQISSFDFFEQALLALRQNIAEGFSEEVESHEIMELLYSRTLLQIISKRSKSEVILYLQKFRNEHPNWKHNRYTKKFHPLKRIFIYLAGNKSILLLRILVWINELRIKRK